ncbi:hypothetical protein TRIUR3_24781 [Triticum urartu]|uniref:Uncharacterized protein n=1 Tax=Triticum urartu TaxID=4572 RepID=M8AG36_TRIUA|nr:hypothetical protein TRIUR3_24781 [Triticum urartu]
MALELKNATSRWEFLEKANKAKMADLDKALREAKEARSESRAARKEIRQAGEIAAGRFAQSPPRAPHPIPRLPRPQPPPTAPPSSPLIIAAACYSRGGRAPTVRQWLFQEARARARVLGVGCVDKEGGVNLREEMREQQQATCSSSFLPSMDELFGDAVQPDHGHDYPTHKGEDANY